MKFKLIMLVIACAALSASIASARTVATATPIDPFDYPAGTVPPVPQGVGNLNPPAWLLGGWFTGQESYAAVFNPSEQVTCDHGFQVASVNQYLDFEAADVPVTFNVYAGLGSAVWDESAGCFVPGPMECQGAEYTITIDAAGTYNIAVPLVCECAFMYDPTGAPYQYYVSMTYTTAFNARVVSDGVQATCTTFNDYGTGWVDLEPFFTTYGNVNVFGDASCCDTPVATESRTWGAVKGLFR